MNRQQFNETLIAEATKRGLTDAEVFMQYSESANIAVYEGAIDRYETSDTGGVSFRALVGGKMGYAYTEKLDASSITFLIDQAIENAHSLDEDDGTTLFEGSDTYRDGDFYSEELANVTADQWIDTLLEIERRLKTYDERIQTVNHCTTSYFNGSTAIQNTKGLNVRERANGQFIVAGVIATDGKEKKSGFHVEVVTSLDAFDVDAFVEKTAEEALSQLGSTPIPSAHYPVVLRNDAATSLLGVFLNAFSAESVQKGTSRLKGKIGEVIASKAVTIVDNPVDGHLFARTTFDGEGVATKKRAIVKEGTLETFLHNRKTAKKEGVETTGHAYKPSYKGTISIAPHHFVLEPTSTTVEQLIAPIEKGVYITDLAGLHSGANAISGDFSVAANGFVIENGTIGEPITQMTIAGNFFDYLQQIEGVANDLHPTGISVTSPTIRLEKLAVTVEQ